MQSLSRGLISQAKPLAVQACGINNVHALNLLSLSLVLLIHLSTEWGLLRSCQEAATGTPYRGQKESQQSLCTKQWLKETVCKLIIAYCLSFVSFFCGLPPNHKNLYPLTLATLCISTMQHYVNPVPYQCTKHKFCTRKIIITLKMYIYNEEFKYRNINTSGSV